MNGVNREIEETVEKVKRSYRQAEQAAKKAADNWSEVRQLVQETSMHRFVISFGRVKNIEVEGSFTPVSLQQVKEVAIHYESNARSQLTSRTQKAVETAGAIAGVAGTLLLGPIGGGVLLVGQVFKGVKLQEAIEEARAELERVKAKAEEVRTGAKALDVIRRRADELSEVTYTLDRLFGLAMDRMDQIIATAGTDFRTYTPEQKQAVKVAYHFFDATLQVLKAPLVDKNSKVTAASTAALKSAREAVKAAEAM